MANAQSRQTETEQSMELKKNTLQQKYEYDFVDGDERTSKKQKNNDNNNNERRKKNRWEYRTYVSWRQYY